MFTDILCLQASKDFSLTPNFSMCCSGFQRFQVPCLLLPGFQLFWCPTSSAVLGSWLLEVAGSSSAGEPQWGEGHRQRNPSVGAEHFALLQPGFDPRCRPCGQTYPRQPTLPVPSYCCFLCKLRLQLGQAQEPCSRLLSRAPQAFPYLQVQHILAVQFGDRLVVDHSLAVRDHNPWAQGCSLQLRCPLALGSLLVGQEQDPLEPQQASPPALPAFERHRFSHSCFPNTHWLPLLPVQPFGFPEPCS